MSHETVESIVSIVPKRSFIMYSELSDSDNKLWLVHGLLGQGEASAVYGQPGCGKSVLVEDMALHITAGREWHGKQLQGRRGLCGTRAKEARREARESLPQEARY
jgi:ABC-type glutathione transport system ATPase component